LTVPEQVRRQSEAVAKMYAERDAEGDSMGATDGVVSDVQASQADSGDNIAPESAPVEQRRSDTKSSEEAFEQRYRTLQGMYNADTGRLRAENQHLSSRVTQLEQLLSTLSTAPSASQSAATEAERLVTAKDIEDYGDSIEVMRRVTREEVSAANRRIAELEQLLRQVQTNIVPRVEQVAHRQAVSTEQSFWNDLTSAVPDWRDINSDQRFHQWLLEVDPLTGFTRQSYLEDAQRNMDARRVAAFFRTWAGMSGQNTAQPNRNASDSELSKQVVPGRSRGGSTPVSTTQKTYTAQDITKFFDDVRRGVYKGKEAERDRIERDIFAAQRENRIVATG
jgi:hypothetical protein